MPIPLLVWAAAGLAGAWVAWKNKKEIGEFLQKAAEGFERKVAEQMKEGEPVAQELMQMEVKDGFHYMEKTLPYMESGKRAGVGFCLIALSQKSVKAQQYLDKFNQMKSNGDFFGL